MTAWARRPGMPWRRTFGFVLVLVPESEPVVLRDGLGELWSCLTGPKTEGQLAEALAAVTGSSRDVLLADVERGLVQLVEARLVVEVPG